MTRITEIEFHRTELHEKEPSNSLERQIATLLATIKTKDTEIAFLKRTIDTHKDELTEARDQYSEAVKLKIDGERRYSELQKVKTELEYEVKYLTEREETLKKKLENREQ
jgi:predicted  nucleic acid-binding Zn-ribbon protein